ncbi:Fic family protein [Desulfonatronum thioautotrophicum]|uniref:Fic family protein n=1 Tax=Desulfonatronum thioautotrophicum TaxID=617001 RepID=UPI0005EB7BBE|nr:Fic family protein [Desulfonatronum thioautotrophicum]
MPQYIWQLPAWPHLQWNVDRLLASLAACRVAQGALRAKLEIAGLLNSPTSAAAALEEDAVQTAAIEGETLDREQVRSSVARHLGLDQAGLRPADRATDGLVQILLDATRNHHLPLTVPRIQGWHAALFPTGYSGLIPIRTGAWRNKPLNVVSGPIHRSHLHFTAPPPETLDAEMTDFLAWWSESKPTMDGLIRAGLAHLRFVTIHPFDDGNGRLARTLTDMALAQDENRPYRHYSLSAQIMAQRKGYYDMLEATQKGDGEVTPWLVWFLRQLQDALTTAGLTVNRVLQKAEFWRQHAQTPLNERQRKVVNRLLEAGCSEDGGGFEGGLTNRKYTAMARTSRATAFRELADLVEKHILRPLPGKGRGAAYELIWP